LVGCTATESVARWPPPPFLPEASLAFLSDAAALRQPARRWRGHSIGGKGEEWWGKVTLAARRGAGSATLVANRERRRRTGQYRPVAAAASLPSRDESRLPRLGDARRHVIFV